jgi:hypothetical protein
MAAYGKNTEGKNLLAKKRGSLPYGVKNEPEWLDASFGAGRLDWKAGTLPTELLPQR